MIYKTGPKKELLYHLPLNSNKFLDKKISLISVKIIKEFVLLYSCPLYMNPLLNKETTIFNKSKKLLTP